MNGSSTWRMTLLSVAVASAALAADFVPEARTGAAIQKAIDAAAAAGGGRVALERGAVYPSGTLYLKSRVELNVPEGTVILGGGAPADYDDVDDPRIGRRPENSTKVFIACLDGDDVSITGKGVIDGQGVKFYDVNSVLWGRFYAKPPHPRTRMIQFFNCRNVRFEDITFKDSPGWTCWMRQCENFTAERVKIVADQKMINNDGFHIDSCRHVRIRNCDLRTGDDCVVMRAIRVPRGGDLVCEDMLVENCTLNSACQCIRLGCPSDGTIRNGVFRNLKMSGNNGVISVHPANYLIDGEHGSCRMEAISIEDCDIDVAGTAILFHVAPGITLRDFGNVTFRNVRLKSKRAIALGGTGDTVLRNIRFENVTGEVDAERPVEISNAEGLHFDRFAVRSGLGKKSPPAVNTSNGWERALPMGSESDARPSPNPQPSTLQRVDVPAQSFDAGGWKLDVQFIDVMGSPYLLAHGCGNRVADAKARVEIPSAGTWRVWVRSRKWVDGAGAFKVRVDGNSLSKTFGASQSEWAWEDGGTVSLGKGTVEIALEDMDGFDGRCAGVALTRDNANAKLKSYSTLQPPGPQSTVDADFVVVGGGVPGTCAAVAAARRGLRVALVQDRPVLGGNASSEIRVWSAGEAKYPLVRELRGWFMNRDANMSLSDAHRMRVVEDEKRLSVHLCHRVVSAETEGGRIVAVKALDWKRNRIVRFRAPLFCDATGDGWLGYYAGADWRMGREARSEYDEPSAPEKADGHTLGASLMWTSAKANTEIPFSAPWAEPYAQGETAVCGEWNWEYGIRRDMIQEGEAIRDRLLLAIYGAFSRAKKDPVNARLVLDNVPFLLGKRESRRLLGDWVYSERDVTEKRMFEDAIAAGSWSVDLHYDDCKPGVDFLTTCRQPHYGRYWIPYRSIYSRNVSNLFMAGRCFSCTHVGLGGPRVINTLAQLGCAAGEAAAMCRGEGLLPRGIWEKGLVRKLQRRLGGDFPGNPDPETAGWRIVDDETPGVTFGKGWRSVHNANGEQVGDVAHVPGKKSSSWNVALDRSASVGDAVYPLPVEKKGRYTLLSRVPYYHSAPMDSRTRLEIVSDGKAQKVDFNQAVGSGTWQRVGEFELSPGATLSIIASESHGCVVADGFALVPMP